MFHRSSVTNDSSPSSALLRGLRRPGDEPQLTQAIAAVAAADPRFAAGFLRLVVRETGSGVDVPAEVHVSAEEVVPDGRVDLRFRAEGIDVIVELKIHAGYGPHWLDRYLAALTDVKHAFVVAVTRDDPTYGEPPANGAWLGATRWKRLLPGLRELRPADPDLLRQWLLFLDVLETEGSMGFTQADPELFAAYGQTRRAIIHIEDLLRSIQVPLLNALRDALGGEEAAGLYWKSGRRFGRTRWARISIPFRVPADGPWRVRAGFISWNPPAAFFVQAGPDQRWDRRRFSPAARLAVDAAVASGFDPLWMADYLPVDDQLVTSERLEERLVEWAHGRFAALRETGLLALPITELGDVTDPGAEAEF
jgi:hypothetical protein